MKIYLAPKTKYFFNDPHNFGCFFNTMKQIGGQNKALEAGCIHFWDNGRFTGAFTESGWIRTLERYQQYAANCVGVLIPDVPFSKPGTLADFEKYWHIPKMMGYKVAFATQNGMAPGDIPWDRIDCVFIGGDHNHKKGVEGQRIALEAQRRGLWIHVGRVQSGSKIIKHWPWANSYDGTTLIKHPTQQLESIKRGLSVAQKTAGYNLIMMDTVNYE